MVSAYRPASVQASSLSGDEINDHALIARIYGEAVQRDLSDFRLSATRLLKDALPFDTGVWASGVRSSNEMLAVTPIDLPLEHLLTYSQHWQDQDFVRAAAVASPGRAFRIEDCMDLKLYHETPIYRAYSSPAGIEHSLGIVQPVPGTEMADLLFLFRSDPAASFSDGERAMIERITRHLASAWHHAQLVNGLRLASSAQARIAAPERCALIGPDGLLHAIGPVMASTLRSTFPGWRGPYLPVPLQTLDSNSSEAVLHAGLAITSMGIEGHRLLWLAMDEGRHGLTPAEVRVARLYVGGMTQQAIARSLKVSSFTVRNQLSSVYQKLGVHSKIALVRALGNV